MTAYQRGDKVRVEAGPHKGKVGKILSVSHRKGLGPCAIFVRWDPNHCRWDSSPEMDWVSAEAVTRQ